MTTVTNNYSLVQPVVGGDINLWGGELNNGVIAALDGILGNVLAVTMTSADVTLTPAQFQNAIFNVSGTLVGSRNLIIPLQTNSLTVACGGRFVIINNTTAIFTVKTQAVGSTGVVVPVGFAAFLYSDGTNVNYCSNGLPAYAAASNGNPNGQLAGTAGSATTNASLAWDYVNNIFYVCTTTGTTLTAVWSTPTVTVARGFDTVVNLGITATHTAGNLLNVAINQANGTVATVGSPIIVPFQTVNGSNNTTGLPTLVNITGALSMNTSATGATFGVGNNAPFRVWLALFNNAGTAVLAMRVCSALGVVYPIAEYGIASTIAVGSSAKSAGIWYTPSGTALSNCAFRVIGYCEYTSGLATAGTFTSDPNNAVLYSPGIQLPGATVQKFPQAQAGSAALQNTNGTVTVTGLVQTVTMTSPINIISATAQVNSTGGNNSSFFAQLGRNSNSNLFGTQAGTGNTGSVNYVSPLEGDDQPGAATATYGVYINGSNSSFNGFPGGGIVSTMKLIEIMG